MRFAFLKHSYRNHLSVQTDFLETRLNTSSDENLLNSVTEYGLLRYPSQSVQFGNGIARPIHIQCSSSLLFCAFIFGIRSLRPSTNQIFSKICTWLTCIAVALPTLAALVVFLQQKIFIDSPAWTDPRFTGYTIIGEGLDILSDDDVFRFSILDAPRVHRYTITFSTVLAVIARYILMMNIRGMRVGQELAQLKNLNSLKLCCLGFSRMRMTMGIVIFHIDVALAPDGVTESGKTVFDVTPSGANGTSI
ncbi:hypothetical protein PRIPAC_78960 [Pristionchus pacificus]|uniref:Uncharacterized protein n=1 Tax=Pristionchus pacificus TaxID=54126 RepID=A0A2A6CLF1_PRIPA|nr:hypothetical protein PRIPAC_78960 [Pristionchus pacificus]|eukprot:PDM79065.1 hypothetical protein PRIPAC_31644 [Pristionchus pacificus]